MQRSGNEAERHSSQRHSGALEHSRALEYGDELADEDFWRDMPPRREPTSARWFLPVVGLLLLLNIPWYLPHEVAVRMLGGLPLWCWLALATSFLLSSASAFAALTAWADDE